MLKEILTVNNYFTTKVGPFNIRQPLPHGEIDYFDPFLLIHHSGPEVFKPGQASARLMPHPHCGFEPVTFLFDGEIYHRDSLGNEGFLKKGDVQWMTSGRGIIHSEGPTEDFSKNGGTMELIQLWVNLPAKFKRTEPGYQQVNRKDMPLLYSSGKKIELQLVSGSYKELKGPVKTFSPVISMMGFISGADEMTFTFEESHSTIFYLLSGNVDVNGTMVTSNQCVFFANKGTDVKIKSSSSGKFLLLSGEKLNEPVVSHGPFVMNTQHEIHQAIQDYNAGKMGHLEG